MAVKSTLVDDLDGQTEGAETVTLSLNDKAIEIDLAKVNIDKLERALAPYFDKGREVVKKKAQGTNGESAKMRAWLKANGHPNLSDKGKIPGELQEKYNQAHAAQG